MPRFAANLTMLFNEVPLLERLAAARAAGFDAVEILFPYEQPREVLAERAREAGVEIVLCNLPPGDWAAGERGFAALPARVAEFSAALGLALDYAGTLGVKRLHLMAGNAPWDDWRARERYREALLEASDAAGPLGIDILIEPLNRRDMPGYFLDDFARAAEIIAELGRDNIKLQFDIYHRQILHGDVARGLTAMMPIIGHIQVASVPLRQEPGTGELDDFHIFGLIDALDYTGSVGCEYRPRAGTAEGLGWLDVARSPTNFRGAGR